MSDEDVSEAGERLVCEDGEDLSDEDRSIVDL